MKTRESFPASNDGIGAAVEFTRTFLEKNKITGKEYNRAVLTVEEAVAALVDHADEDSSITLKLRSFNGSVVVDISSPGSEFNPVSQMKSIPDLDEDETGESTKNALQSILLKSFTNGMKYRHKTGINSFWLKVVKSSRSFLFWTLGAMLVAILVGIILDRFVYEGFNTGLDTYVLTPVKDMFLDALKMCVAPVVFFSIISCVMQFSDLAELGRIGGKVFCLYLFTTVIAVGVGLGMFFLFQPGNTEMAATITDASSITSQNMNVSILDTIKNIIPENFIKPFLDSDMMQLIFMAILMGIGVGMIGKYSQTLRDILNACNELFLKVTTIIIRFMPIAVFCSICSMMLELGARTLISLLGILGTFLAGLLCMMLIYCLLFLILGRLNPIPFVKKYIPTMLQVFSMASSNAAIPLNMEACDKKFGISPRVYTLSIPLGATVNMDGTCVYMGVFSLALAKVYGVDISGAAILSLIVSIIVLSIGAPGIPGSGLICLSVLLTQIQVPVEAVGIVMGIDALIGMFRAMSNCLGDVVASSIVAKSEGLMDLSKYKE